MIRLKNALTRTIEEFVPDSSHPTEVRMYHCGPTVYQRAHAGNMRAYVFADVLRRTFELAGHNVRQVINITDVGHLTDDGSDGDDKLEREAAKNGESAGAIAAQYTNMFLHDLLALNIRTEGTLFPKATDHITEQIELIQTLEAKGYTYQTSDTVYFDTAKYPEYGKLGGVAEALKHQREGARIGVDSEKKNPADFALWKLSPNQLDPAAPARQQEWPSPWGVGFPGWHIECSAMSMKYLGETFDIHTGGIDHIAVHHNDEIAQSEAATGAPFARYWLHANFITINGTKVSKSLGNTVSIEDLMTQYGVSPLAYRYWLLTGHYASEMNLTADALKGAATALKRLKASLAALLPDSQPTNDDVRDAHEAILGRAGDDLDTPGIISLLWSSLNETNNSAWVRALAQEADKILALNLLTPDETLPIPQEILVLATQRDEARTAKDWAASDRIRSEIEARGFIVRDSADGSIIERE